MGNYKLSEDAENDLIRIHQYGFRKYGETQAEQYYLAFFEQFERIAENPLLFQSVYHVREGYRRCVCGADSIYYRINGEMVEIIRILGQQNSKTVL